MYSAISKYLVAAALVALAASCGDAEKDAAQEIYSQSEAAVEQGNYSQALELIDTLNARYATQTEIRRMALGTRAKAMQGIAIDSIQSVDAQLAQATLDVDRLTPQFHHVAPAAAGLDGYWLPQGVNNRMMTTSGIQARVTDDGYVFIVVNVQDCKIGLQNIELRDGNETCTSGTISSELVTTVKNSETASFRSEYVAQFGPWLEQHPGSNKIVLCGSKGNVNVKMTAAMRNEIISCCEYAHALQAKRSASIRREKFERMLATARDQIANLAITAQSND